MITGQPFHSLAWKNELINLTSAVILFLLPARREALFRYCSLLLGLGYCSKAITVNLCACLQVCREGTVLFALRRRGESGAGGSPLATEPNPALALPLWFLMKLAIYFRFLCETK